MRGRGTGDGPNIRALRVSPARFLSTQGEPRYKAIGIMSDAPDFAAAPRAEPYTVADVLAACRRERRSLDALGGAIFAPGDWSGCVRPLFAMAAELIGQGADRRGLPAAPRRIYSVKQASEFVDAITQWVAGLAAVPKPPRDTGDPDAKSRQPKRRGAPQTYDPADDKKLLADWAAAKGQGATREEFCRGRGGRGISVQYLIGAQHREKYRRKRDAE
jgi:hypothetical protein